MIYVLNHPGKEKQHIQIFILTACINRFCWLFKITFSYREVHYWIEYHCFTCVQQYYHCR